MNIHIKQQLIPAALALVLMTACNTGKSDLKNLIRDVESYHRDLIFERYEIAAKYITPESRMPWLEAMRSQNLRFAEIEILSTEDCTKDEKDAPLCMNILSQMQWYAGSSPVIKTTRIQAVWQFDAEEKAWHLIEQSEF